MEPPPRSSSKDSLGAVDALVCATRPRAVLSRVLPKNPHRTLRPAFTA